MLQGLVHRDPEFGVDHNHLLQKIDALLVQVLVGSWLLDEFGEGGLSKLGVP